MLHIRKVKDTTFFPMVLCGNKCDLPREVPEEKAKQLADSFRCPYYETSAKVFFIFFILSFIFSFFSKDKSKHRIVILPIGKRDQKETDGKRNTWRKQEHLSMCGIISDGDSSSFFFSNTIFPYF